MDLWQSILHSPSKFSLHRTRLLLLPPPQSLFAIIKSVNDDWANKESVNYGSEVRRSTATVNQGVENRSQSDKIFHRGANAWQEKITIELLICVTFRSHHHHHHLLVIIVFSLFLILRRVCDVVGCKQPFSLLHALCLVHRIAIVIFITSWCVFFVHHHTRQLTMHDMAPSLIPDHDHKDRSRRVVVEEQYHSVAVLLTAILLFVKCERSALEWRFCPRSSKIITYDTCLSWSLLLTRLTLFLFE